MLPGCSDVDSPASVTQCLLLFGSGSVRVLGVLVRMKEMHPLTFQHCPCPSLGWAVLLHCNPLPDIVTFWRGQGS